MEGDKLATLGPFEINFRDMLLGKRALIFRMESRKKSEVVTVTSGTLFGMPRGVVHVSVLGKGACFVRVTVRKDRNKLVIAGVPGPLADKLMKGIARFL